MTAASHQTVRLAAGRHASRQAGVCVMELASMLAHEPFSDRARSISPTIGAFLRTYNDGIDDDRRQDLYPVAAAVVGPAARPALPRRGITRCLAFARRPGAQLPGRRAALGLATPEAAGAWAARLALEAGAPQEGPARGGAGGGAVARRRARRARTPAIARAARGRPRARAGRAGPRLSRSWSQPRA